LVAGRDVLSHVTEMEREGFRQRNTVACVDEAGRVACFERRLEVCEFLCRALWIEMPFVGVHEALVEGTIVLDWCGDRGGAGGDRMSRIETALAPRHALRTRPRTGNGKETFGLGESIPKLVITKGVDVGDVVHDHPRADKHETVLGNLDPLPPDDPRHPRNKPSP
jgi:hypothetical protein